MFQKIKEIVGSIRFWIITLGWASDYSAKVISNGFNYPEMFTYVALWLGTVAGVGSIDKWYTSNQ